MLIQDLRFFEQIDNLDDIEGGANASAIVVNKPYGVGASAYSEAEGNKNYVRTYTKGTAYPKANGGAASAVASDVKGTKIDFDIAYDIGFYIADV